ncbi:MAG: glycosyltransferase family 2 protein [Pseudonocardiaceae bacterium]
MTSVVHTALMRADVITAVHAAYAGFLPLAWASLRAQSYRDWTWLVQVDGPEAEVLDALSRCGAAREPRVRVAANGTREGPATTRNVALGGASAPLVHSLDADDELEPDALALLVAALQVHPAAGFAVGHVRDLLVTGELREHLLPVPSGVLPRGVLLAEWVTNLGEYRLPVHPAGVLWRRSLLLSVGAWSALSGMEDTGLLMAASATSAGVLLEVPTLRYRKHPGQRSARESQFSGGGAQVALVRQRAAILLRRCG